MATGQVLPGYGDPIRRARSAFPSERSSDGKYSVRPSVSQSELARIKEDAFNMWIMPRQRENTTYDHFFTPKRLDVQSTARPSSPTRMNNPHPQQVFLVNRLHYIPGYHIADTTMGKDVYKIDASLPPHLQAARRGPREKYRARPSTTSINQYRFKNNFRDYMEPREAQAMEAWVTLADDKDKEKTMALFPSDASCSQRDMDMMNDRHGGAADNSTAPLASLHRYLKPAGISESNHLSRVMETIRSNPERQLGLRGSLMDMRDADMQSMSRVQVKRRPYRGDFLIHPEWPPYMPHHRIPGF